MIIDKNIVTSIVVGRVFLSGRARGWGRVGVGSNPKIILVSACLLMASADAPHFLCN
jgi:hypothetical protein